MAVGGLTEEGERELALHIVCLLIAVIATVLRLWCKAVTLRSAISSFHADDWLLVATTISYLGAVVGSLWGLFNGNKGRDLGELTAELSVHPSAEGVKAMENYLESLFIGVTILYFTFYLAKLSICALYRRIFVTKPFRRTCTIFMGISTAWFIAVQVTNLVICLPIDSFWDRNQPHRCLNFNIFSLAIGIVEIVIDAAILLLPVRAVLSLQMPKRTKIIVMGIFLLGGFSVITNILRVAYMYQPNEFYVSFRNAMVWSNIHAAVTILCACLPVYKPIRDLMGKWISAIRDRYASLLRTTFTFRGSASRSRIGSSKNGDEPGGQHESDSSYELSGAPISGSALGKDGDVTRTYHVAYPSNGSTNLSNDNGNKELVLSPGEGNYSVGIGAGRRSDTSGEEYFHAGDDGRGNTITRTTKVEIV